MYFILVLQIESNKIRTVSVLKRDKNTIRRLFEFTQDENSLQTPTQVEEDGTEGRVLFALIKVTTLVYSFVYFITVRKSY